MHILQNIRTFCAVRAIWAMKSDKLCSKIQKKHTAAAAATYIVQCMTAFKKIQKQTLDCVNTLCVNIYD